MDSERYEQLWQRASTIPGYITKNEGNILYSLAKQCSHTVVEIGAYCGRSTVLLGTGVREGHPPSRLLSIENFSKKESSMHPHVAAPRSVLKQNVEEWGLEAVCEIIENDSVQTLTELKAQSCGLIFIDSDHTGAQIAAEFPQALRALHPRGTLVIHDYSNPAVDPSYTTWIDRNVRTAFDTVFILDSTPAYRGNGLLVVKLQ